MRFTVFSVPIAHEKKMLEYQKNGIERKSPYCDDEYLPLSEWNYAYSGKVLVPEKGELGDIPFSNDHSPIALKQQCRKSTGDWKEDGHDTVYATPNLTSLSQILKEYAFIPTVV